MTITEREAEVIVAAIEALQLSNQRYGFISVLEPDELELYKKISKSFPEIPLLLTRLL